MTTQPTLLPPGAISVVAADSSLTLRWGASASPEVVAYRIYRRNPDGSWPAQPMEGSTHTEYVDLEVKNGQVYAYRIASVDAAGNMSMAQEASGTPVGAVAESKTLALIAWVTLRARSQVKKLASLPAIKQESLKGQAKLQHSTLKAQMAISAFMTLAIQPVARAARLQALPLEKEKVRK